MSEIHEETATNAAPTPDPKPRRKRTGRKRTSFQPPLRPAPAVRDLWRQASEEEQKRAHRTCVLMLEYWLGKKDKQQVAAELDVPTLRVWQLSQQALSGMLAGLLKQPRTRRKLPPTADLPPGEDPKALKRRIAELERKLGATEDLVRVLRTAPWVSSSASEANDKRGQRAQRKKPRGARKAPATRPRDATASRGGASQPSSLGCGDGGQG